MGKQSDAAERTRRRQGRPASILASCAVLYACVLVPAAFLAPVYHGETASSSGPAAKTSGTLVAVNGSWVAALACVPLVLTLAGWVGLNLRCRRGSRFGGALGWTVSGLLCALAVLGLASVGVFVLPAAVLFLAAAAWTPTPRPSV
jgi:hypothetical protein